MKTYLNLGCGSRLHDTWTNADLYSANPDVIILNALESLPFEDNAFEVIYASHVIEHIPKNTAPKLLLECRRILQKDGIMRIVAPDLEQIALNYLACLKQGLGSPDDPRVRANYEWAMLELYDQCVRMKSGGEMLHYLARKILPNEEDVYARGGNEIKNIRKRLTSGSMESPSRASSGTRALPGVARRFFSASFYRRVLMRMLILGSKHCNMEGAFEAGAFRLGGEPHQWMYDRYSLALLLQEAGFSSMRQQSFAASDIQHWKRYNLDMDTDGSEWKPFSLYMEARK